MHPDEYIMTFFRISAHVAKRSVVYYINGKHCLKFIASLHTSFFCSPFPVVDVDHAVEKRISFSGNVNEVLISRFNY